MAQATSLSETRENGLAAPCSVHSRPPGQTRDQVDKLNWDMISIDCNESHTSFRGKRIGLVP